MPIIKNEHTPLIIHQKETYKSKCCQFFASIVNKIKGMVHEIFSLLAAAFLYPFGWFGSGQSITSDRLSPGRPPVILVHGFLHNKSAWYLFERDLHKKGWTHLYSLNLGNPLNSIESYAERVKELVEKVRLETKSEKVILVGHSMGGIVSTHYALSEEGLGKVERIVTLGSPLQGTKLAVLAWFCKCAREMSLHSPFLNKLNEKIEANQTIPILSIGSKSDIVVLPWKSAFANGPRVTNIGVSDIGHMGLIYDKKIYDLTTDFMSSEGVV